MGKNQLDQETVDNLLEKAKSAMQLVYAPYSKFKVGCALLTFDNQIIFGCNIESASYGATNCGERTALFSAIAQGYRPGQFKALACSHRH